MHYSLTLLIFGLLLPDVQPKVYIAPEHKEITPEHGKL